MSPDVVGYQDLDANGTWRADATYGNVWIPNRVAAGWAPYRDGHWAWVDPWGWTWVDDAPWGFAVSHYGRWTNLRGTWGWVPGPVRTRAYYAPALVAFVGGDNFQLTISSGNIGGVAWFPLGPREVYRPSYRVSRGYFENVNRSNTVINNTIINNYYDNSNVNNVVYANRQVPGAVVAVPTTAFVQSQPVSRAAVRVYREMMVSAPVASVPPVAPIQKSVRGAAAQGDKPPSRVFGRPVVARTAPPAASAGFAAQRQLLTAKPGKPLDDAVRRQLKPQAAAPAPVVKLVAPAQMAVPTARPPPVAPGARPANARGTADDRNIPKAPAISGAPGAPAPGGTPSQTRPPAQQTPPWAQRENAGQRGNAEQGGQPVAAPPASPQNAPQRRVFPWQAAQPVPATQAPEHRGNAERRGQPVAAPPAPPQRTAEPKAVPPKVAPAPATQAPPQRSTQPKMAQPPRGASPAPATEQPAPEAESRGQKPKRAGGKPNDKKKDSDEQKREEEDRKHDR